MRQSFWHGQTVGSTPKKKKKRKRKFQSNQVPLPTIHNFPCCPVAAQNGWPIKNSGTQQLTERMPAKVTPCAEPGLVSDDITIHPSMSPCFSIQMLTVHDYMFIHVLFQSSKSTARVQTWSQLSPRFQMLVPDWLNRSFWPAAQTLKRYGEKTAFQNSQTASANIFHQNKKGHPNETISSKRWMM
jgi:hypothetical protein